MRAYHQTEDEEDDELAEPSESVEEAARLTLAGELAITNHETTDINGEIGVSLEEIGDGEDKDAGGEHHDRVERLVAQIRAAHDADDALTKDKTKYGTHDELDDNILDDR